MGRKLVEGFNTAVEGALGSSALVNQNLVIQVKGNQTRKHLSKVVASFNQPLQTYTSQVDRVGRIFVCTGYLSADNLDAALAGSPFAPLQATGINRMLFSQIFRNECNFDFTPELQVLEGETLNIVLWCPWTVGDTALTASESYGYLSAIGRESFKNGDNFQYDMV